MNICIVHDSELGNGERLANRARERLNVEGHTVIVGHERTLTPTEVLASRPNLLIVGTAVRKFSLSPVTKRWIDELGTLLRGADSGADAPRSSGADAIARAAVFVTHALKKSGTERKGTRVRARLVSVLGEERVYPRWISARVVGPAGPFRDGVEEAALEEIDAVVRWAQE